MRTIQDVLEKGEEVKPIVKHVEFMSKKALQCQYLPETFSAYDACVRERASRESVTSFGVVDQCETAMYFSKENMVHKANRSNKQGQGKKKGKQACWAYNDGACQFKFCNYGHFCSACEEGGHGRRDCPTLRKKNRNRIRPITGTTILNLRFVWRS